MYTDCLIYQSMIENTRGSIQKKYSKGNEWRNDDCAWLLSHYMLQSFTTISHVLI